MRLTPFFRAFSLRIFLAVALSLAGFAAKADIHPGKEYELLSPPQAVETGKKIEVLEIFSYTCPHCFDLEADINRWAKQLPKDVEFRRLPAIFRDSWTPFAKVFYTFEAMGLTERLHGEFFNAIHAQHIRFDSDNAIFDWVEKQGISRKGLSISILPSPSRARHCVPSSLPGPMASAAFPRLSWMANIAHPYRTPAAMPACCRLSTS